jgi:ech hydrogenase subunit F
MGLFAMTIRALANVVGKPATLMYPVKPAKQFERSRGMLVITIEDCIYCGLCSRHCPADAIVVSKDDRTWQVDRMRCIICAQCVDVCPKSCLALVPEYKKSVAKPPFVDFFQGPPAPPKPEKKAKEE